MKPAPGCGLATDGSGVVFAQRDGNPDSIGRYLVDAETLRTAYRDQFLKGLSRLRQRGELRLTGEFESLLNEQAWNQLLSQLRQVTWVSYIQPPPQPDCRADQVLKYLAGYLAGGPISNSRIIATDQYHVTFMARRGETAGGDDRQIPITLSQVEFTRRWCLHVLPEGYTRTRRFGGWSNTRCARYQERLAIVLESSKLPLPPDATEFGPFDDEVTCDDSCVADDSLASDCPKCGSALIPHRMINKPSWSTIMSSARRPVWYQPSRAAD